MIRNSFTFLEGISFKTANRMRDQGISDWDRFISSKKIGGISDNRKIIYDGMLLEARKALADYDSKYFLDRIPKDETWRLYDFFKDDTVYLDIETSSCREIGFITVIGLFDGLNTKVMIRDVNLDVYSLKKELERYKLMVTFNGNVFDIPFIKKRHPGLLPDIPTIDLRFLCQSIGLKGGLKVIEKVLGLERTNHIIDRLRGGDPITLWKMFRATGDDYYLNLLVEYNEEDVMNLKPIMEYVYKEKRRASIDSQKIISPAYGQVCPVLPSCTCNYP
jgi:uncharacterized protein